MELDDEQKDELQHLKWDGVISPAAQKRIEVAVLHRRAAWSFRSACKEVGISVSNWSRQRWYST